MPSSSPAELKVSKEFGQKGGLVGCSAPRQRAALKPRAELGKCGRGRLLNEIVKYGSGSDSNNAGDNARGDEYAHRISPVSHNHQAHFLNAAILPADSPARSRILTPRWRRPPFQRPRTFAPASPRERKSQPI